MSFTANEIKILQRAEKILMKANRTGDFITSPDAVTNIMRYRLAHLEQEQFHVVYLTNQNQVITINHEFSGTIDCASVYPREIVKQALKLNAAAVIFAHNHPSGLLKASNADILITDKLKECLSLIDIRVLDHIIVAGDKTLSFAEKGLI